MQEIIVNDQLIKYRIVGSGQTPIFFLHGWRSDSSVWGNIAEKLSKDYKCFLIDLPGFGYSPAPKTAFNIDNYADLVYTFADKLNLGQFILIGHSFGGRIAIKLAAKYPKAIKKLVLVDSAGIKKENPGRKNIAKLVKPIFKPGFMHGLRKKIYQKMGSEDYIATPELKETYLKVVEEDLLSETEKISQPTLLIWGDNDRETPIEDAKIMNEKIKNSRLEILENAEHFSFIDQPNKFIEIVKEFIK